MKMQFPLDMHYAQLDAAAVQIASYYIVIGNLDNFPLIPTYKRGEKKEKVVY